MGGKTGTTTQSVQIPPEVMARYNAVNTRAETTAQQPFQQYGTSPESFVAQLNPQQQQGISNVNQYAGAAQPGYQAAMQGTAGAYGGLTPQGFQQGVQGYMSPFLSNAMGATAAQMQNINRQQQQDIIGNAVKAGAFGGDRGSIARAALANQQNLAMGQTLGQMAQQGYQSAAQNYLTGLGQQGQLAAQMGALGAGAQQAGLQGAQAQIGAGTLGQQTEQAGKTALYNQFLQQQAYPFQVAQFLANIAMGTGALSGSQTTTTQPMSFFSDRRLKEDIKRIGETDQGLPIYKFKYKGDPEEQTHVGFMADEVEKVHPEAVGESHGYKTVDYDKATSEGGAVLPKHEGLGFAAGGLAYDPYDPTSIQNILARQQAMFATPESHYVPLARQISGGLGKHSRVPESVLPVGQLRTPSAAPQMPESMLQQGLGFAERAEKIQNLFEKGKTALESMQKGRADLEASKSPQSSSTSVPQVPQKKAGLYFEDENTFAAHGGAIHGYAEGGLTPEAQKDETPQGLYSAEQTGKLNIPTESKNYKLAQQSMLPGSMQDPTMKDIMAIVGMFKSHGGRAGYEGGGNVDVDPYLSALGKIESSGRYEALGPLTKGGDRAYGKYQVMGANIPSWTEEALGKRLSPEEFLANKEAQDATARHHFGKFVNQYGSPEDAASVWFSGKPMAEAGESKDILGTTVPAYVQKFRSALGQADMPAEKSAMAAGDAEKAGMPSFEEPKKTGGLGDLMTSQNVIPLLVGLGTMASSRSPFLGSAILEGLGGAASAYLPTERAIAEIEATKAGTEATKVATGRGRVFQVGNMLYVVGADDQPIPAYQWLGMDPAKRPPLSEYDERRIRSESGGLGAAATATETPKTDQTIMAGELPAPGEGAAGPLKKYGAQEPKLGEGLTSIALSPDAINLARTNRNLAMLGQSTEPDIFTPQGELATSARNQRSNFITLAGTFSRQPITGLGAPGPAQNLIRPATDVMNNLISVIVKDPAMRDKYLIKDPLLAADQTEIRKLITQLGAQATTAAGQRAYSALQEISDAIPSGEMSKESQSRLMALLMANNQKEIDKDIYYSKFFREVAGNNNAYSAFARSSGKDLEKQFENDYNPRLYKEEAHQLERMFNTRIPEMLDKQGKARTVMDVLTSGESLPPELISGLRGKFGNSILRYFGIDE